MILATDLVLNEYPMNLVFALNPLQTGLGWISEAKGNLNNMTEVKEETKKRVKIFTQTSMGTAEQR